jgi:ketosteroid isomerase-like protein
MATDFPGPRPDAPSGPPDTAEEELLAAAEGWAEAIVSNDASRIASFVTDDWVLVSESGISPGYRFLALVASGDLTHSAMDVMGPTRVRLCGETALLTARIASVAHYQGRTSEADEWTTDVFVRQGGRWLCALTHYTAVSLSSSVAGEGA